MDGKRGREGGREEGREGGREEGAIRVECTPHATSSFPCPTSVPLTCLPCPLLPPPRTLPFRWYLDFERAAKDLAQIELRKSGKVSTVSCSLRSSWRPVLPRAPEGGGECGATGSGQDATKTLAHAPPLLFPFPLAWHAPIGLFLPSLSCFTASPHDDIESWSLPGIQVFRFPSLLSSLPPLLLPSFIPA